MKKLIIGSSFATTLAGFAQIVAAQVDISAPAGEIGSLGVAAFINQVNTVINIIIPFLIGLAVLVVIYGVFGFISNAADEEARASAKQFIIWGIIGIFIMLSVWGLVSILENTFVLQKTGTGISTPTLPTN